MVTDAILDTSILVDLLRAFPAATGWFASLGRQRLAITPVVWMETVQGATDRAKRAQAIRFLRQFRIEHPTEDDNR
jgi:predicted nucleic acid-binding protein